MFYKNKMGEYFLRVGTIPEYKGMALLAVFPKTSTKGQETLPLTKSELDQLISRLKEISNQLTISREAEPLGSDW
jgi:hypothetical protein